MKAKINPRLVPICVYYFFLTFGNNILWPYFTLQMRSIGLTLSDAGLVGGLAPIFAFVCTPLFGYVGDKIGYKIILIMTILLDVGTSASMNFLPVYREHAPKVALNAQSFDLNSQETIDKTDIVWFGVVIENDNICNGNIADFVIKEIVCDDKTFAVDITFEESDEMNLIEDRCTDMNATSCKYSLEAFPVNSSLLLCDANFRYFDGTFQQGSHSLTLWTYFALRTVLMIVMNACYNITDATAATLAQREHSSFSLIIIFGSIGGLLPPLIMGPVLDNVNLNSKVFDCLTGLEITAQDFKLPFSVSNGILLLLAAFAFGFLDVRVEAPPRKLSLKEEFSWLANSSAISFYLLMFIFGVSAGASDTYFFVYAQEELGASATLLGYMSEAGQISGILILPFAKFLIKKIGSVNMICISMIILCGQLVLVGLTHSNPPWEFIGYKAMDGFFPLMWVSVVIYSGKIAPAALTATAISLCSTIIWIAGKGVGTLLSGLLINKLSISLTFIIVGSFCSLCSMLYWVVYHLILKKYELNHHDDEKGQENVKSDLDEDYLPDIGYKNSTRL